VEVEVEASTAVIGPDGPGRHHHHWF